MKRIRTTILSISLVLTVSTLLCGHAFSEIKKQTQTQKAAIKIVTKKTTKKTVPKKTTKKVVPKKTSTLKPKPKVTPKPRSKPTTKPVNNKAAVNFTDSAGRKVVIPSKIIRIVPSGQLAQIVLFALAPEKLVGISNKWSADTEKFIDRKYYNLPVLGQFYGTSNLNLEEIAKANPQIIIDVGEPKSTIVQDMDSIQKQVGIPAVHITATTATMGDAYRKLGRLLGKVKEAEELALYCEKAYSNTQNIMKKVGDSGRVKLLYCSGTDGLSVLAKGSFHSEILDMVSNNAAVVKDISSKGTGNPVDMEQILLWDPDVIIFAPGSIYNTVSQKKEWQNLTAIKNGRYYEVPSVPYNWMGSPPSVNRYLGMVWITQLLYPGKANYDEYKEVAKYYKLFYHCNITQDQYKSLVSNSLLKRKK